MAGFTNRGKFKMLQACFNGTALPTNFFVALCTSAVAPTADTNIMSELTQIAAGNGYTAGGLSLTKNTTDFPSLTEDDATDRGFIRIKNLVWTAAGGSIPATGNPARWAVLTDDNATPGSREIWMYFDLASDRTVSDTQTLTLQACEMRLNEV